MFTVPFLINISLADCFQVKRELIPLFNCFRISSRWKRAFNLLFCVEVGFSHLPSSHKQAAVKQRKAPPSRVLFCLSYTLEVR